ncbi:MAG: lysophospholipid acyltransferase family protein [Deltaproteobacteria bacterium]|nr:lysophospholipid acyltransferase family protein [Deltaproteobacteria bacterium]
MSKRIDAVITSRPFLAFLYRFIRAYAWTFRLEVENETPWMAFHRNGGRVLLCAWHQQFFAAIRHFQNYRAHRPGLMISRSKDGEIIAGVASRSGWEPVRGSSSRGGAQAMREMIEKLQQTRLAGHIVDGPRGPAGVIKNGLIRIAHASDAMIVPFYVFADQAWYFKSWDRFMLPKPFSRVRLRFDEMIRLAATDDEAEFEAQRVQVEKIMLQGLQGGPIKN